jgi:hypothetical protein
VREDRRCHDLDASFSKRVEYIASQFSVGVEDALAAVGPSAKMVFHGIVPKRLFQDFGSRVGYDLFGSAGALMVISLVASNVLSVTFPYTPSIETTSPTRNALV